jgi:hypothetical protein
MRFPVSGCWEAIIEEVPDFIGERGGTRTLDSRIRSLSGSSRVRMPLWARTAPPFPELVPNNPVE